MPYADPEKYKEYQRTYQRTWRKTSKGRSSSVQTMRRWRSNNPDGSLTIRRRSVLKKYDITLEEYQQLLDKQGGVCAICKKPETSKSKSGKVKHLAVDHVAGTKKVRGLLCWPCNSGIGKLRHDPELLAAAIEYLEKSK